MLKLMGTGLLALSFMLPSSAWASKCEDAKTSIQMNRCAAIKLEVADHEMAKYLEATYKQHAGDEPLVKSIKLAQKEWEAHVTSHCDSVYTMWREGSQRTLVSIFCMIDKTDDRTLELWETYLSNNGDSTPVLPKPLK